MAAKRTKFIVGLFIISGLLLIVVLTIWLGATKFFTRGFYAVTFFDESVQGLNIDAPVKYRGVMVGMVEKIRVASDGALIEVILKLELNEDMMKENLNSIVSQLRVVGITGSMFVELDRPKHGEKLFLPGSEIATDYPVIPSKQSDIVLLISSLSDLADQLKQLHISSIGDSFSSFLKKLNTIIDSLNLQEVSENIRQFSIKLNKAVDGEKIRSILEHTDEAAAAFESVVKSLSSNTEPVGDIIAEVNLATQKLNKIFTQIDAVTDKTEISVTAVTKYLTVIMQQLEYIMDNMERFSAKIADQPSQLLLGDPPENDRN